jgi:hypothetical protein
MYKNASFTLVSQHLPSSPPKMVPSIKLHFSDCTQGDRIKWQGTEFNSVKMNSAPLHILKERPTTKVLYDRMQMRKVSFSYCQRKMGNDFILFSFSLLLFLSLFSSFLFFSFFHSFFPPSFFYWALPVLLSTLPSRKWSFFSFSSKRST